MRPFSMGKWSSITGIWWRLYPHFFPLTKPKEEATKYSKATFRLQKENLFKTWKMKVAKLNGKFNSIQFIYFISQRADTLFVAIYIINKLLTILHCYSFILFMIMVIMLCVFYGTGKELTIGHARQ